MPSASTYACFFVCCRGPIYIAELIKQMIWSKPHNVSPVRHKQQWEMVKCMSSTWTLILSASVHAHFMVLVITPPSNALFEACMTRELSHYWYYSLTGSGESKLLTDNCCIQCIPVIVTNCSPGIVEAYFYPPLINVCPIDEPNTKIKTRCSWQWCRLWWHLG